MEREGIFPSCEVHFGAKQAHAGIREQLESKHHLCVRDMGNKKISVEIQFRIDALIYMSAC